MSLQKAWATDPNFEGSIFAGSNALYTDESIPAVKDFNDALPNTFRAFGTVRTSAHDCCGRGQTGSSSWRRPSCRSVAVLDERRCDQRASGTARRDPRRPRSTADLPGRQPALFPMCYFTGNTKGGAFHSDNGGKPTCIDDATAAALMKALAPS
ncbi:hypothetical protein [Nocardia gipuzkoensis]|uniref:hypothetical protein n=1 Tax=Nocardia gipuzkoensis TaxID=2749991 RepID=UPI003EDEF7D1